MLFLFRFWPVLLPLVIYLIWLRINTKRALKRGEIPPHFRDGPWYWIIISSLAIGAACFAAMALSIDGQKGNYEPPHMENGVLIPGKVVP